MKRHLIVLLLSLSGSAAAAGTGVIEGSVVNASGAVLSSGVEGVERSELGVDQLFFVVAEIDGAQRQQGHRNDVEQQDAPCER